jgi:hypothetical protein
MIHGYHESGVEFDRALGYPEEVSQFLFERVAHGEVGETRGGHVILDVGAAPATSST